MPNSQLLRSLCAEYLAKLEEGKLEPAEQSTAATLLSDLIRRMQNSLSAYQMPDDTVKVSER